MTPRTITLCMIISFVAFCVTLAPMTRWNHAYGAGNTRIITDMLGRKVEIPSPTTRVALFGGPTGQIAYVLGARGQLCAVTKSLKVSQFLLLLDPSIKNLPAPRSTSGQVNLEELILSNPQVVIAGDMDGSIVERKTRIPVAYIESSMSGGIALLKREIRFYGEVFQRQDRAEKYIAYMEDRIAFVRSRVRDIPENLRKSVFLGYGPGQLVTLGGDTFMNERIEIAGCRNASSPIATSGKKEGLHVGLDEVSMERILLWNPDIVVIDHGEPETLFVDAKWKDIDAVRNRRVFRQPVGVFIWDRPTAEATVLQPMWLAKTAYPERFEDLDLVAEFKRFYREMMSFEITDVQARALLGGRLGVDLRGFRQ